ncbi:EAL domain-containing protein [Rhodoferax sp. TS-BS-61-7]|uniref:EAL domain-containing protein n=1 Tax=Rhodoferax sp. TS-BS-61-7 TaxID=2094194 RepID=UPI000CF626D7|nr:EAL domain-containing protein [Rhodoferax sp. TS-BS-61-7]PQA78425.1 sensor domain-containing diguanylate cyclase [Rhodoferax sp. TS-BS-61-7]
MLSKIPLWLGRLSVGRKLTLIYLLDLTAVIYVSGILIHEKYLAIDFARKEIVGAHYAEVVRRNLMGVFRVPAPAVPPQAVAPRFADDLKALDAIREAHDAALHTTEASQRLHTLLQTPSSKGNKTALLSQGRDLLTIVGNQSNLILDPDLDSYYVMSLTVLRFPELLQVLYDTRDFMQHWGQTSQGQNPSAQLLTLVGRLDAVLQGMESDYEQAWLAGTPQLQAGLGATRTALLLQARQFSRTVQAASADGLSAQEAAALEQAYQAALAGLDDAWRVGLEQMQLLLDARVDGLFQRMWLHLGTALLLLGCILSLVYLVASQIARPLQALARVADDVRHTADYTRRASWHSRDEIGQLFTAFNGMLAQLDHDRLAQQELAASARAAEAQLELVEAFPMPMVVTSVPDHEVLHANAPAQPWLGGLTVDPWRTGLEASVRGRFFQRLSDFDAVDEFEVRWLGGSAPSWAVLSARRLKFQGRDAILTAFAPINKLKVMEQRLELWAKVFEASSESIIIMDESRKIISVNRAFCRSTAYDFYEVIGHDLGHVMDSPQDMVWSDLEDKDAWQGEVRIRKQSGESYPAWLMVSAVHKSATSGEVVNYIGISIDITDRKAKEERIRFLAQHDVLTELPNRSLCQQRLAEALAQAQHSGEKVAVLFIDLDRFKFINDTLGHHIGDGLLRTVARRLSMSVRADDTVSRLGGDEFVIILRHVVDREELSSMVNQRLMPSLRQSAMVEGNNLTVSCSVGVALYPEDATAQDELMRRADAAMYEAKAAGRDMARFFSPETDQRVQARQTMEGQLRQALANDEFSLHFQPRLNARTRRVQGAEALLRWHNPLLGQVAPSHFIHLAEETGLIKPIGLWVLREACAQWVALQAQGLCKGLELSVNLSVAQLADPELVDQLRGVLEASGMEPGLLELELTESQLMDNPVAAQAQVSALKALGVHIAIDDFGTGYSSLAYLKRFEIDKLKVDQSFVYGMLDDSADAAIVHAVIALGHTLGLKVVAEGVENLPTAQTLTALGCDELQGYCFSRPLAVDDWVAWLQAQEERPDRRRGR